MSRSPVRAAVVGSPVGHSLSPAMYNACFAAYGKPWVFDRIEVGVDGVGGMIDTVRSAGYGALSVTMPLKEAIIPFLDALTVEASTLRAVNAVVNDDGRLVGHNTDGDGCCDALEARGSVDLRDAHSVLLGAGGTARSVALALAARGARVRVVNRTTRNALDLVDMVKSVHPGADISLGTTDDIAGARILVNTTNVGMNSEELPVPASALHPQLVVLDAVYSPLTTALLSAASFVGATVVDGLWMLVHQGCRQYHLWFGEWPDPNLMRAAAEEALASR